MRIALVITELHPGGAERCFVHLALYLAARGHEVQVWQLWPAPSPEHRQLVNQLDQAGIPWHSGTATNAWGFVRSILWLRRELRRFQPELAQAFLFHANLATALSLPLRTRFVGGARVRQPQWLRGLMQRWAARYMDKLVCVSQAVANHCHFRERIPIQKLEVIPNGIAIDVGAISAGENQRAWDDLGVAAQPEQVILFVGRLSEQKGVLELIEHAHLFLEELQDYHLVLMGDGDQRRQVEKLRVGHSCAERIHIVGRQAEAVCWMQLAHMVILPTKYEGMPNVILEAMAIGKPVVSFNVEGVDELLGSGPYHDVQSVVPGDYHSFALRIVSLCHSNRLATDCGNANQARVQEYFQLEQQLHRYEQLYQRLIHSQPD